MTLLQGTCTQNISDERGKAIQLIYNTDNKIIMKLYTVKIDQVLDYD